MVDSSSVIFAVSDSALPSPVPKKEPVILDGVSLSVAEKEFVILKGDAFVIVGRLGLARGGIVGKLKSGFKAGESVGVTELCAGVCVNFVPSGGGGQVSFQIVYELLQYRNEYNINERCRKLAWHQSSHRLFT